MDILKKFRVVEDQAEENLSKSQKLAVTGLAIFGFIMIIFWGLGMKNNIYKPLRYGENNIIQPIAQALTEEEKLRNQDTDKDGLSDWDELYVYFTSPYLEDTDSDGIGDGVEVRNRQDPNCPLGQDCGQLENTSNQPDDQLIKSLVPEISLTEEQVGSNQDDLNKLLSGTVDATTLRKLMLSSGVDESIINQMTDQDLMQSYTNTLQSNALPTKQ